MFGYGLSIWDIVFWFQLSVAGGAPPPPPTIALRADLSSANNLPWVFW